MEPPKTHAHAHTLTQTHTGVYLSLKGTVYANSSAISITEIGKNNATSNTGLQCITDRMPCCASFEGRAGDWYFPNGTRVPVLGAGADMATAFYRNRGNEDGTVNLNRLNTSVFMPTGLFCCEVSDAAGMTQRLCADIIGRHVIYMRGLKTDSCMPW